MARRGRALSYDKINRIAMLLSKTEMTLPEIAERMSCSRSAVAMLNRKLGIREYSGRKVVTSRGFDDSQAEIKIPSPHVLESVAAES